MKEKKNITIRILLLLLLKVDNRILLLLLLLKVDNFFLKKYVHDEEP